MFSGLSYDFWRVTGNHGRFGNETFDVGIDSGTPASENYHPPFADAWIKTVKINIQPSDLSASDQLTVRDAQRAVPLTIE